MKRTLPPHTAMHRRHRPGGLGFTLVEVLAALVLVGVVLPVAMRGLQLSMQTAERARRTLEASQLAQQKMAEALVLRDPGATGMSGTFGDMWPEYRWQSTSQDAGFGVYLVTVRVSWQERVHERWVEQSTLIYPVSSADAASLQLDLDVNTGAGVMP